MILVTGAAGFIGFHLAKSLLDKGHEVVGIDNFSDYYPPVLKRYRDAELRRFASFRSVEMDLCNLAALEQVFKRYSIQYVCNLAAQPGIRYSLINPFVYQKSNIEGFINLIEVSHRHRVKNFIYASSSSVYGGISEMPFSEGQRVEQPLNLYAATKKANELFAHTYSHLYGMKTVGLRFFTVYGPASRPDMATWLFTESILAGDAIKVFNHGKMKRDFTYIDDIVKGVSSAIFKDDLPPYSLFNLGNHKAEDLLHLVQVIEKATGRPAKKIMMEVQAGDMIETYADITKAQQTLSYQPSTAIEEGVPRFVEWFMANRDVTEAVRAGRKK